MIRAKHGVFRLGTILSKSVINIDDSVFLLGQLKDFFTNTIGYDVVVQGNSGNQALELYLKHKPDLITMDIVMPGKEGLEAIKEIINVDPNANILIISADRGQRLIQCLKSGAKGFMDKPLKPKDDKYVFEFKKSLNEIFEELI